MVTISAAKVGSAPNFPAKILVYPADGIEINMIGMESKIPSTAKKRKAAITNSGMTTRRINETR